MQVQKINNSQLFVKNKSNNNACDRKSLHNVSFGAKSIETSKSLIEKLYEYPQMEHVRNFFRQSIPKKQNIYIGSSLYDDMFFCNTQGCLEDLKEAGIKTIINLDTPTTEKSKEPFKKLVEQAGLKYYNYPMYYCFESIFRSKNISDDFIKEMKDKLVDFIKEIQKDNVYINSNSANYIESAALIYNWFSPDFYKGAKVHSYMGADSVSSFVKKIYPFFTANDEEALKWTSEFKQMFNKELKLIE